MSRTRWVTVSFAPIFIEFITPVNHEIVSTPQPKLPVRPVSLLLTPSPSHVSVNMCGTNYQMVVDDAFPVEDKLKNTFRMFKLFCMQVAFASF